MSFSLYCGPHLRWLLGMCAQRDSLSLFDFSFFSMFFLFHFNLSTISMVFAEKIVQSSFFFLLIQLKLMQPFIKFRIFFYFLFLFLFFFQFFITWSLLRLLWLFRIIIRFWSFRKLTLRSIHHSLKSLSIWHLI